MSLRREMDLGERARGEGKKDDQPLIKKLCYAVSLEKKRKIYIIPPEENQLTTTEKIGGSRLVPIVSVAQWGPGRNRVSEQSGLGQTVLFVQSSRWKV